MKINEPDLVNALARSRTYSLADNRLILLRRIVEEIKSSGTNEELFKLRDFLDAQATLVSELIYGIGHGFTEETKKDR